MTFRPIYKQSRARESCFLAEGSKINRGRDFSRPLKLIFLLCNASSGLGELLLELQSGFAQAAIA